MGKKGLIACRYSRDKKGLIASEVDNRGLIGCRGRQVEEIIGSSCMHVTVGSILRLMWPHSSINFGVVGV